MILDQLREEVHLQRAAGNMDVSYERWMDQVFARLVPGSNEAGSFEDALEEAEAAGMIDAEVPVSSRRPAGRFVKRLLRKAISWYMRFVVQQVRHSAQSIMRVLHMMDERLGSVEARMGELCARAEAAGAGAPQVVRLASAAWRGRPDVFMDDVAGAMLSAGLETARVLHAECGKGEVVSYLRARAIDAYGVDSSLVPDVGGDHRSAGDGLDLRLAAVTDHLSGLADGELAGVLLSGCVDCMTADEDLRLLGLCARKVRSGGVVAVVGTYPRAWQSAVPRVVTDLARGRPLHPETWEELFRAAGIGSIIVSRDASGGAVALDARSGTRPRALDSAAEQPGGELPAGESFLVMGKVTA